jgi:hypothetical protein
MIHPAMATKWLAAARIASEWKTSWNPNVVGHGSGRWKRVDAGADAVEQRAKPEQEKRRGPQAVKELRQRCKGHAPDADGRAWRTSEVGSILGSQVVLPAAWWRTLAKLGPRGRTKERVIAMGPASSIVSIADEVADGP